MPRLGETHWARPIGTVGPDDAFTMCARRLITHWELGLASKEAVMLDQWGRSGRALRVSAGQAHHPLSEFVKHIVDRCGSWQTRSPLRLTLAALSIMLTPQSD